MHVNFVKLDYLYILMIVIGLSIDLYNAESPFDCSFCIQTP